MKVPSPLIPWGVWGWAWGKQEWWAVTVTGGDTAIHTLGLQMPSPSPEEGHRGIQLSHTHARMRARTHTHAHTHTHTHTHATLEAWQGFMESAFTFRRVNEIKSSEIGTSLVVQWLGRHIPCAGSWGSIPGQETKIPHATTKDPKCCNKDPTQPNK